MHTLKLQSIYIGRGYAKSQTEDCRCLTLPNGERICDPIDCTFK